MNLARCIRTIRHLKPGQLIGQVRVRVLQRYRNPAECRGVTWNLRLGVQALELADPVLPQAAHDLADGRFTFVNRTVEFDGMPDWDGVGQSKLWQYNLNYFDWLWSLLDDEGTHWQEAKRLTLDWIERHPPNKVACGWEPYPTSLRLMNWCLLYGVRHASRLQADQAFRDTLMQSVGRQVAWLEGNLETHIQANHLLENVCALMCVVSVLDGPECERLRRRMAPLLRSELEEQFLDDGMHYERSPMYHLRMLWLLEMLSQVGDEAPQGWVVEPLRRGKIALGYLCHPDQEIAQFNDAAIGVYADSWQSTPSDGAWSLPDAGYYGFREGGNYVIADGGPVGPDHQPGHAHADFLSFEMSLEGRRVITDTGIGTYEVGRMRSHDRSTAAHSTVEVAGQDSVEVWGSFRVGRRTVPELLEWEPRNNGFVLEAQHDGYAHLSGAPMHCRKLEWVQGQLVIHDKVVSRQSHEVVVRFHLAPGVQAQIQGDDLHCQIDGFPFVIEVKGPGGRRLEKSMSYPRFGEGRERLVFSVHVCLKPPGLEWHTRIHAL